MSLFRRHFHINAASWLGAEHLMWWWQLSSQMLLGLLWTPLSEAYPYKYGSLLHGILQATELQPYTTLPKEDWILGRHHLFVILVLVLNPLSHTLILLFDHPWAPLSSSVTHGPILLLGSFIPTTWISNPPQAFPFLKCVKCLYFRFFFYQLITCAMYENMCIFSLLFFISK